ncbi:MAG: DUF2330 domain-containing protein, partial [Planctomycetota bacterium]
MNMSNRMNLSKLLLLMILFTPNLSADGGFFWERGADLNEPAQKAVICWKDGVERMILQVKFEDPPEDFAWIVPVPSRPRVEAVDAGSSPFEELSIYTFERRGGRAGQWGMGGTDHPDGVTVLEQKIVGVYDITVLAADDAGALSRWLNNHGYSFPQGREDVLRHYTDKRWFYVAMRIDRKALGNIELEKLKIGELQPVRFTFAAHEMVYPMKISSINSGETEVLLYLLSDAPAVVKGDPGREGLSITKNIAHDWKRHDPEYGTFRKEDGQGLPLTWAALDLREDLALSICKYRVVFDTAEIVDDLTFVPFDPIEYWNRNKQGTYMRIHALSVLASYDENLREILAKHEDETYRMIAASHPKTDADLLEKLAEDEHRQVRESVARNAKTPEHVLFKMLKDKKENVRHGIIMNPSAPSEVLRELARDDAGWVRKLVVDHENTPLDVLSMLAHDGEDEIRSAVAKNSAISNELLTEFAQSDDPALRSGAARNPAVQGRNLRLLAEDPDPNVRSGVAGNANTPAEILKKLTKDESTMVRTELAKNMLTPVGALRRLEKDPVGLV